MRKILTLLLINIVLALFQTAFFPVLFGKQTYINWVLIFGFSWLLVDAPFTALKSVFIGGIILDILLGSLLGVSSLIMTIGIYAMVVIRKYFFRGVVPHLIMGTILSYIYIEIAITHQVLFYPTILAVSFVTPLIAVLSAQLFKQILARKK